ncbi:MAG: arsenic resistance N-acetyltransferase ArsN2 [Woeseiaceae bacterium]
MTHSASSADIQIRPATQSDLAMVIAWLDSAGLPSSDLRPAHLELFLIASCNEQPAGMIGLESYADSGLLRSLYVADASRGLGLGAHLVLELEQRAAAAGLGSLWLLTIDADPFFVRLGYEVMPRSDAPPPVQQSAEFSSLCPGDAVLMRKVLGP